MIVYVYADVSEALARFALSHIYMHMMVFSVGTFGGLAHPLTPPPYQKAGYATGSTLAVIEGVFASPHYQYCVIYAEKSENLFLFLRMHIITEIERQLCHQIIPMQLYTPLL